MAWATVTDVGDITGVSVDAATVAQAQGVIEVYANRTDDATDGFSARDLGWLKRAVCWQAAWLKDQYGYTSRQRARSTSQDGTSITRVADSDQDLAPLAARALKNLSWLGSRTTRARGIAVPRGGLGWETDAEFMRDARDSDALWEAMG